MEVILVIFVFLFIVFANLFQWVKKVKKEDREAEVHREVLNQKEVIEDQSKMIKELKDKPYSKIYYGPVFKNIENSTIVNASKVLGSIENINNTSGADIADVLLKITNLIHESENVEAAELFEAFTSELDNEKPKKSILKQLWGGIEKCIPTLKSVVDTASKFQELIY